MNRRGFLKAVTALAIAPVVLSLDSIAPHDLNQFKIDGFVISHIETARNPSGFGYFYRGIVRKKGSMKNPKYFMFQLDHKVSINTDEFKKDMATAFRQSFRA